LSIFLRCCKDKKLIVKALLSCPVIMHIVFTRQAELINIAPTAMETPQQ